MRSSVRLRLQGCQHECVMLVYRNFLSSVTGSFCHLQALQQQLVSDCDRRLAAASEAEGAIRRATATQVESLQRQVASLASLQAENEDLKAASEVRSIFAPS